MHLVVVQHGLWGAPGNTAYLSMLLREQLKDDFVLNSDVNVGNLTYDGVDVCGDRLSALILSTIHELAQSNKKVHAISMVGYSMGGLITRYVAGKLYAEGLFDTVTPVNFVTVATPHLGSWRMPSTWYNRVFNYMVPVVTSRSGYQLVLQDKHLWGKPLLCLMSHPDLLFMRALGCFQKLMLLANVFHDRPVPYCTAAIRLDNPYEESQPVPIDPKYPSIVTTAAAVAATAAAAAAAAEEKQAAGGGGAGDVAGGGGTALTIQALGTASPLYGNRPESGGDTGHGGGESSASGGPGTQLPERDAAQQPQAGEAAAATAAAKEDSRPPQRPLRSSYLKVLMVLFFPLAIPALLLMVITGRSHHSKMMRTALDFSWIQRYHDREHQRQQQQKKNDSAGAAGAAEDAKRTGTTRAALRPGAVGSFANGPAAAAVLDPEEAVGLLVPNAEEEEEKEEEQEDGGHHAQPVKGAGSISSSSKNKTEATRGDECEGRGDLAGASPQLGSQPAQLRMLSDIECPSAPDLPALASASAQAAATIAAAVGASPQSGGTPRDGGSLSGGGGGSGRGLGGSGSLRAVAASGTAPGALDDGDDEVVVVSEQTVLLHDGIVELPAEMHRVQEWLVEQLNKLPWHKVDVDCRDYHAHAAIVIRNPMRFRHCRDVLNYLCDNFLRA